MINSVFEFKFPYHLLIPKQGKAPHIAMVNICSVK